MPSPIKMDKPTAEILNFSLNLSDSIPVPSHLSQARSRSDSSTKPNVKRPKPNGSRKDEGHSLKQLQIARAFVDEVIELVLNSNPLKYGYGFYYQKVESICKYKHAEQSRLGDHLKDRIEFQFYDSVKPAVVQLCHDHLVLVSQFVAKYLEIYQDWEFKLRVLGKLFLYIDRSYLLQHPNKKVILELGLDLFITNLLVDPIEEADITIIKYTQFLEEYQLQPDHAESDTQLLESLSRILIKLNFNNRIKLNVSVTNLVIKLFNKFKTIWIKDPSTYIHKSLSKISEIITFFKQCGQSKPFCESLLMRLKWELIFTDFNQTIQACLPYMLKPENEKQLVMVYRFCKNSYKDYSFDSMLIFISEWGKLIISHITAAIQAFNENDPTGPKTIIPTLVKLNEDFNRVVVERFENNTKFEFEIRNAFSKALNTTNKKTHSFITSQLCKYVEGYFRAKKSSPITFKQFETDFLIIFKYLTNKNDFIIIYKRELSKRLLLSRNVQMELEKQLADSMVNIVGETDDSMGLGVMFRDLAVSQQKYNSLTTQLHSPIEFQPLILEQKHWPEIPKQSGSLILPAKFTNLLEGFNTIYKEMDDKSKNHRLDWDNYQLHQLSIVAHFESGEYELQLNLLQATVIDLFNEKDQVTSEEIMAKTNMDPRLLKRILHSLTEKYKILEQKNDVISFNKSFSDKSKKLRIPVPRTIDREAPVEEKQIVKNRDLEIRGAIIRIIKPETKILYTDLITKTLVKANEAGRGAIAIQDIKASIEYLIQNEFISRDHDHKTLTYVP